MNLSKRARSVIESVRTWHVPPECQGQIIEVAFGMADDGIVVRRTFDRSDRSVCYATAELEGEWDPWNGSPSGLDWTPLV